MSSLKPKVTIGICVRNCEKTISEAIESIIMQDYPHELMEVIFVDDGSEDRTFEVIKEYLAKMDMNIKVFHHKWKGIGFSRNVVLKNASGDYIIWIDGDMKVPSNYTRKLVEFMDKHPNVGIAKGKQSLKKGANILGTLEGYSRAASRMVNYKSPKARYKSLGTGGAIYRLKAIIEAGDFDEKLRGYGEDFDAEIRIKAKGWKLAVVDVDFYDYESYKLKWQDLWRRYWFRGFYSYFFLKKNRNALKLYNMTPIIAMLSGLICLLKIYKLTRDKLSFLIPVLSVYKAVAWCVGYINAHKSTLA
jgi:glycosyltransferase involved in cell wall biosynthesis